MEHTRPEQGYLLPRPQYGALQPEHGHKRAPEISVHTESDARDSGPWRKGACDKVWWASPWLRKTSLLGLSALFIAMAISLIILARASESQNGFPLTISTNHYTWTYGPTAILVVVVALWRQVDYHCKLLEPWQELHRGPADAKRSLLLDYITSLNITSFCRAVRYRHYAVIASILGFALLKIVTLVSTALLVPEPTPTNTSVPVTLTTEFDGNSLWSSLPEDPEEWYSELDSTPVRQYFGAMQRTLNSPPDIDDSNVLQWFDFEADASLRSVSTEVDMFRPNVTCETAKVSYSPGPSLDESRAANANGCAMLSTRRVQLTSASCSTGTFDFGRAGSDTTRVETYGFGVNCSGERHSALTAHYTLLVTNVTYDTCEWDVEGDPSPPTVHMTTAVICNFNYSMNRVTATRYNTTNHLSVGEIVPKDRLDNITQPVFARLLFAAIEAAREDAIGDHTFERAPQSPFVDLPNKASMNDTFLPQNAYASVPLWYLIFRDLGGGNSMDPLFEPVALQRSAAKMLNGLSAYFMKDYYLRPTTHSSGGTGLTMEDRLHVKPVALWIMVSCLLLLIPCVLMIIAAVRKCVVRQNPSSIATIASTLAASSSTQRLLRRAHDMRTSQLTAFLHGYKFHAPVGDVMSVTVAKLGSSSSSKKAKAKAKPWVPLAAKYYMMCLTFGVPILAIAALEALYSMSSRNDGIRNVSGSESTATYVSQYVSIGIIFLVASLFTSLDVTIASFAPYSVLRSGSAPARRSIRFHILGNTPLAALWRSLKAKHFASAASNVAAMLGSILTIVGSGLWVIDRNVPMVQPIQLPLAHTWNATWPDLFENDGGSAIQLNTIQHGGAAMSPMVWNNHVLPRLAPRSSLSQGYYESPLSTATPQNVTMSLKALRPELSCEVVPYGMINTSAPNARVSVRLPLSAPCQHGGPNGTNPYYSLEVIPSWEYQSTEEPVWVGRFLDLHLGPLPGSKVDGSNETYYPQEFGEPPKSGILNNPMGCPSIGILFGAAGFVPVWKPENFTALLCSQRVEEISLNVTYQNGNLELPIIAGGLAPVSISGSSHYLDNGTKGFVDFPYRPQRFLTQDAGGNLTTFPGGQYRCQHCLSVFDEVFNHIVYGPNGTSLSGLFGKANQDTLIKAVQLFYMKYMTLVIDNKFRQPTDDTSDPSNLAQGEIHTFTSRLKVNFVSKLVLQILLAIMTVLGALAVWLGDLRGTLPRKPTSIASVMGFLAGSEMCTEHSMTMKEAGTSDNKGLDALLDGWFFSLGWWPERANSTASYEDDSVEDTGSAPMPKEFRFGIDVGAPEQLGFRRRHK